MSGSNVFIPHKRNKVTFTSPGSTSFVVPKGITEIRATLVGGGASGGKGSVSTGGHGGSGGTCKEVILNVTPGETLTVVVGAGGAAPGTNNNPGNPGGNSSLAGSFGTVIARGGYGGRDYLYPDYDGNQPLSFLRNPGAGLGGIGGDNASVVIGGAGEDGLYGLGGSGSGQGGGGGGSYGNGGNAASPNSASGNQGGGGGGAVGSGTAGNGGNGLIIIRYGAVDSI